MFIPGIPMIQTFFYESESTSLTIVINDNWRNQNKWPNFKLVYLPEPKSPIFFFRTRCGSQRYTRTLMIYGSILAPVFLARIAPIHIIALVIVSRFHFLKSLLANHSLNKPWKRERTGSDSIMCLHFVHVT